MTPILKIYPLGKGFIFVFYYNIVLFVIPNTNKLYNYKYMWYNYFDSGFTGIFIIFLLRLSCKCPL